MRLKRRITNIRKDNKIFNRTAITTKAGNLPHKNDRGGKAW